MADKPRNGGHLQSLDGGKSGRNVPRKVKSADELKDELIEAITSDVLNSIAALYTEKNALGKFCLLGNIRLHLVNPEAEAIPLDSTGDMVEFPIFEAINEASESKEYVELDMKAIDSMKVRIGFLKKAVSIIVRALLLKKDIQSFTDSDVLQTRIMEEGEMDAVENGDEGETSETIKVTASLRTLINTQPLHKIPGFPKELPPLKGKRSPRKTPSPPQPLDA